jgi:hypothetical protein
VQRSRCSVRTSVLVLWEVRHLQVRRRRNRS